MIKLVSFIILMTFCTLGYSQELAVAKKWKSYELAQIKYCVDGQKTSEIKVLNNQLSGETFCKNKFIEQSLPLLNRLKNGDFFLKNAILSKNLSIFLKDQYLKGKEDPALVKVMIYELVFKIAENNDQVNLFTDQLTSSVKVGK
jgi:hypothetical protein